MFPAPLASSLDAEREFVRFVLVLNPLAFQQCQSFIREGQAFYIEPLSGSIVGEGLNSEIATLGMSQLNPGDLALLCQFDEERITQRRFRTIESLQELKS